MNNYGSNINSDLSYYSLSLSLPHARVMPVYYACVVYTRVDRSTGQCRCHAGYTSSDGSGNLGVRGDCGYYVTWQDVEGYPVKVT